jgi:hypothetical protein
MKIVIELFNKLVGQELSAEEMEQVGGGLQNAMVCPEFDECCRCPKCC